MLAERIVFGRPFVKRFALCYRTVVLSVLSVLSCLSVTLVYCDQTVGRIKVKLSMQVGLGPGHIVFDGDPAPPPPKGHSLPIFGPYLLRPNGSMDQDVTWYGASLGPGDFVVDRDPGPPRGGGPGSPSPQIFGPCL